MAPGVQRVHKQVGPQAALARQAPGCALAAAVFAVHAVRARRAERRIHLRGRARSQRAPTCAARVTPAPPAPACAAAWRRAGPSGAPPARPELQEAPRPRAHQAGQGEAAGGAARAACPDAAPHRVHGGQREARRAVWAAQLLAHQHEHLEHLQLVRLRPRTAPSHRPRARAPTARPRAAGLCARTGFQPASGSTHRARAWHYRHCRCSPGLIAPGQVDAPAAPRAPTQLGQVSRQTPSSAARSAGGHAWRRAAASRPAKARRPERLRP